MRFVLTVFGGRLLNARAKTVSTLATTISPSCRQTTDAIRDRLPDPAPQPERTRPSVRLPLVQPVADLAVQDRLVAVVDRPGLAGIDPMLPIDKPRHAVNELDHREKPRPA